MPINSLNPLSPGPTGMTGINPLGAEAGKPGSRQAPQVAMEAESLFLTQLLQQMRQSMVASVKGRRQETKEYQALIDQNLARTLAAGGGLGLGRKIVEDLAPRLAAQGKELRHASSERGAQTGGVDAPGDAALPAVP